MKEQIQLNPDSPIPLYHQLANIIQAKIRSKEYQSGEKIPSENQLAGDFGIGRPTVRQATDLLLKKGILERKRGSGTYVKEKPLELNLLSLAGTSSAFHEQDIDVVTQIVSPIRLMNIDKSSHSPFSGQKAYYYSRLSRVNGTAILMEDFYLEPELFPDLDQMDLANKSLSQLVEEQYFLKPLSAKQNFMITYLDENRALILELSTKTPILQVNRYLHFKQAQNAVYSELFCRTDQFVFSQTIGGIMYE